MDSHTNKHKYPAQSQIPHSHTSCLCKHSTPRHCSFSSIKVHISTWMGIKTGELEPRRAFNMSSSFHLLYPWTRGLPPSLFLCDMKGWKQPGWRGGKRKSYSCQSRRGRHRCLCKDETRLRFAPIPQQRWERLFPQPRWVQWRKKNPRESYRVNKKRRGSMGNENINHQNEKHESVSRIMLWILLSAT